MGLIEPNRHKRPEWASKYWFCPDCGTVSGENSGQWVRGFDGNAHSTLPSNFIPMSKIPAGVCVYCESENIQPPTAGGEK